MTTHTAGACMMDAVSHYKRIELTLIIRIKEILNYRTQWESLNIEI